MNNEKDISQRQSTYVQLSVSTETRSAEHRSARALRACAAHPLRSATGNLRTVEGGAEQG